MRINLKAHAVNGRQAARVAALDAIIWLWFHQITYNSAFTTSYLAERALALPSSLISIALAIGIVRAQWDRVPRAVRIGTALATTGALVGMTGMPPGGEAGEVLYACSTIVLGVGCTLGAILRLETLAKCDDFATLSVALSGSLMLFYLFSLILLWLPSEVYTACVVAAPLVLALDADRAAAPSQRVGPLPRRIRYSLPLSMPCLVGAAAGFVVALGTVFMATAPSQVFTHPSPLFLIAQLLFLLLCIITVFGLDLRKAEYFAVANLCWGLGTVAGNFLHEGIGAAHSGLLSDISSFTCLMTIVLFLAFSGVWTSSLGRTAALSSKAPLEDIAREAGLTPRETEVALLLLEGRSLRIVQEELFISEGTARTHTKRIYAKLGVHSKQELIDYFKEHAGRS